MAERIDHFAEAESYRKASHGESGPMWALTQAVRSGVEATLALAEQQRIANIIALASRADDRWGAYAGEAGSMGTLFDNPETELDNMRLKPEIKEALGL